jgi:hypothetical protein
MIKGKNDFPILLRSNLHFHYLKFHPLMLSLGIVQLDAISNSKHPGSQHIIDACSFWNWSYDSSSAKVPQNIQASNMAEILKEYMLISHYLTIFCIHC